MATESNTEQSPGGVRTYRGRTLEEIIPQIRAELGADAIILREREGLVGGVGGFFAQRFIEVDARRGDGQSIDIYDDQPESDLRQQPQAYAPAPVAAPRPDLPPEPVELGRERQLPAPEPAPSDPRPFVPPSITSAERANPPVQGVVRPLQAVTPGPEEPEPATPPAQRRFETSVFMDRLREASAILPDEDEEEDEPIAPPPAPPAEHKQPPRQRAAKRKPAAKPEPEPRPQPAGSWSEELSAAAAEPEQLTARERIAAIPPLELPAPAAPRDAPQEEPAPAPPARSRAARQAQRPRPARQQRPARPPRAPRNAEAGEQTPPPAEPQPVNPYETVRPRPRSVAPARPVPVRTPPPALPAPTAAPLPATTSAPAPPALQIGRADTSVVPARRPLPPARREEEGLRSVFSRLVGGLRQTGPTRPSPAKALDVAAATEVATELATRGASQAWTSQLINAAGAHGSVLSGNLRQAAEAEVARRIVPAPALPVDGAAIAFIGAGGAGKTRCTAALASAYRRNSTLQVTVVALDNPDGARDLRKLLHGEGIPVLSLHGHKAERAIAEGRHGGLVIIDTPTTTPTDPAAVHALGATLAALRLDAVYVALPATLGPQAARRALASYGALAPSAVAITHADETDQLAVVVEIAIGHRIPLAYFHSGTDHRNALSIVDPAAVAAQLFS